MSFCKMVEQNQDQSYEDFMERQRDIFINLKFPVQDSTVSSSTDTTENAPAQDTVKEMAQYLLQEKIMNKEQCLPDTTSLTAAAK